MRTLTRGGYKFASVAVLTCDMVDGDYKYLKSFRPLGHESRDIGQFVDDDGTAYLIFEDRPFGFRIAKLSDDYLTVEKEICLIPEHMEGGALVHYQGLYYVIGSALTGWNAESEQIRHGEIAGRAVVGIQGHRAAGNEHLRLAIHDDAEGDRHENHDGDFHGRHLEAADAMGFALSVDAAEIGDGKLRLPEPKPWTLDMQTGEASLKPATAGQDTRLDASSQ